MRGNERAVEKHRFFSRLAETPAATIVRRVGAGVNGRADSEASRLCGSRAKLTRSRRVSVKRPHMT